MSPKWRREAAALPRAETLHLPLDVLVAEAVETARCARRSWTHATDPRGKVLGPGLASAFGGRDVVGEVLELVEAVSNADSIVRWIGQADPPPLARAEFVRGELRAALRWLGDARGDKTLTAQVTTLAGEHARARSHDAVAAALYDYAGLAARHAARLAAVASFDASLIGEATALADALREHRPGAGASPERADALDLRNRLATLLADRLRALRSLARFVFRHHPALIREVTSEYERTRRTRTRPAPRAKA